MVRWIAFDEETADALIGRFKRGASELHDGDALDAALSHGKSSLLLMPSSTPGRVLLARIEHKAAEANVDANATRNFWRKRGPQPTDAADSADSIAYEPAGILGLSDEPLFHHPPQPVYPAPKKKRWWKKSA
jgi:hypothetical protein